MSIETILAALTEAQRTELQGLLKALAGREYRRGTVDGFMDARKMDPPAPTPGRPLISDEALSYLRGLVKSSTVRVAALITTVSAALLDEELRGQVTELLGPQAYPIMGMLAGAAMLMQRIRTVMSIAARGRDKTEGVKG